METTTAEKIQIANTIIQQMGGQGRLRAMIGANSFVARDSGVSFRFKAKSSGNLLVVTLEASDTYKVELFRLRGVNCKCVAEASDIYADNLVEVVERMTGLYLKF